MDVLRRMSAWPVFLRSRSRQTFRTSSAQVRKARRGGAALLPQMRRQPNGMCHRVCLYSPPLAIGLHPPSQGELRPFLLTVVLSLAAVMTPTAFDCTCRLHAGLQVLLWVLSTRLGALVLTGRAVPLPSQSLAARHALLKRWSVSRIGKFREAFQVSDR